MELHYKIAGVLLMILALIHLIFPRYFKWNDELRALSLMNRQMMKTHTFFIALTVFLIGLLAFTCHLELQTTDLGRKISLGLGGFWFIRLLFQFFVYSPALWKGKPFETSVHIFFSMFWIYLSLIFWMPAFA